MPSHLPQAALTETKALIRAGVEVTICTYRGILDHKEPEEVPHIQAISTWYGYFTHIFVMILSFLKMKKLVWFFEQFTTIYYAIRLKKRLGYDIIYYRDGEPFIFLPIVFGLFTKDYCWAVSLIGIVMMMCERRELSYKFVNASFWKPVYRRSFIRNRFVFLCQNEYIEEFYKGGFLQGTLSGRVGRLRATMKDSADAVPREEAKQYLGLPADKIIILNFGALHAGKDIDTVLKAISEIPDVMLLSAGQNTASVNLIGLVMQYDLQHKVVIHDYYIPEDNKKYYLAAADIVALSYKKNFFQTASMLWEAARYRVPVIASDAGELGDYVKTYNLGLLYKPEDVESLKDALRVFIGLNQAEKQIFENNCERFCAEFSIEKWTQEFVEVVREIMP